jgi:hypothetical protein
MHKPAPQNGAYNRESMSLVEKCPGCVARFERSAAEILLYRQIARHKLMTGGYAPSHGGEK